MDEKIFAELLEVPISLPCSVIMSNRGIPLSSAASGLESTECQGRPACLESLPPSRTTLAVCVVPLEPSSESNQPLPLPQRNRKVKRPYSPELIILRDKKAKHKNLIHTVQQNVQKKVVCSEVGIGSAKPFSCEKCKSPFVVNPARSRRPLSSKRKPVARKIVDDVTKKVLVVCNACGLSTGRKVARPAMIPPTDEEKAKHLKESIAFASTLAESLCEPSAQQLYCPAFKMKPCQCLQKYIIGNAVDEGQKGRALDLLSFQNEANILRKQKDVSESEKVGTKEKKSLANSKPSPRGLKLRRSQAFEQFVLSKRRYLRDELGLCERACQRILMYSNNFLHKKVKSAPNNGPRVERTIGKNALGVLKPISELSRCSCCANSCVLLALTHSNLLESWRHMASLGQRQARRALAEMLTPSGGAKANCCKFVAMVTGCSYTTISLVGEHMRQTQGDREPPEHGLKHRWRPRAGGSDDPGVHIPSPAELRAMGTEQAATHLQTQRDRLVGLQRRLAEQQAELECRQRSLLGQQVTTDTCSAGSSTLAADITSSPTISVMTSPGNFEPLGNISNISAMLQGSDCQEFSNVVIIPDPVQLLTSGRMRCSDKNIQTLDG